MNDELKLLYFPSPDMREFSTYEENFPSKENDMYYGK
jgi:hypothetical protein